ncbi:MAG: phosphate-starvation-inducible PsiE family protein [Bacteroidales bacterium]|nr:phosphate-starvation-inducible PsiE family protein [Bacteroidales bacterium]
MNQIIKTVEKLLISLILLIFFSILILAFIDIIYVIISKIITHPLFIIDAESLMELFSLFLIILLGLELLETIKAYLREDVIHVELVVLVAIIALSRKVIIWDFNKYSYLEMISLAIMILALSLAYFLVKRAELKIHVKKTKRDPVPDKTEK